MANRRVKFSGKCMWCRKKASFGQRWADGRGVAYACWTHRSKLAKLNEPIGGIFPLVITPRSPRSPSRSRKVTFKKMSLATGRKLAAKPMRKFRILRGTPKTERMYKHIVNAQLDAGKSLAVASRIAAATVNRYRAKQSRRGGTKLVTKGGSRRQWYPGKARAKGKRRARTA